MKVLIKNRTWEIVDLPPGKKPMDADGYLTFSIIQREV